jgi:hypothetical protein
MGRVEHSVHASPYLRVLSYGSCHPPSLDLERWVQWEDSNLKLAVSHLSAYAPISQERYFARIWFPFIKEDGTAIQHAVFPPK